MYRFDHAAQQVPDVAEAVAWYREHLPNVKVLYQDATWALIDAGGIRLAFVVRDQHPGHLAWRVDAAELDRLAAQHGKEIKTHRDRTRSFYLEAPGGHWIELISVEGSSYEEKTRAAEASIEEDAAEADTSEPSTGSSSE